MDGVQDDLPLHLGHCSLPHIVVKGDDDLGVLADVKARRVDDRRQFCLEAAVGKETRCRDVRLKGRIHFEVNDLPGNIGHHINDALGVLRLHDNVCRHDAFVKGVQPQPAVRVDHDLRDVVVVHVLHDGAPEARLQNAQATLPHLIFDRTVCFAHRYAPFRRSAPCSFTHASIAA